MLFGKKKKKNKKKRNVSIRRRKSSRSNVRRRPSVVSTHLQHRQPNRSLNRRTASLKRRKSAKPKYVVDAQSNRLVEVRRRHAEPEPTEFGHYRQSRYMVRADTGKPVLQAPGERNNIPPAPPPPPISVGVKANKCHLKGASSKQEVEATPNRRARTKRSPDDLQEWVSWRAQVNQRLAAFVLKGIHSQKSKLPADAFPRTMSTETLDAIINHAYNEEQLPTALDRLSYMIYGIPRIQAEQLLAVRKSSSRCRNSRKGKPIHTEKTENSKSGVDSVSRRISKALSSCGVEKGFTKDEKPEYQYGRSKPVLAASPPKPYVFQPRSPPPFLSRKPPIPGGVPTILSGLDLQNKPQVRRAPSEYVAAGRTADIKSPPSSDLRYRLPSTAMPSRIPVAPPLHGLIKPGMQYGFQRHSQIRHHRQF